MRYLSLIGAVSLLGLAPVQAEPLFVLDVSICNSGGGGGEPTPMAVCAGSAEQISRQYHSMEAIIEALSNTGLSGLSTLYNENSAAEARLFLRGLPTEASYDANSATLTFRVPSIGLSESFNGATRDESEELFEAWFKGDGQQALSRLLREMARVSPVDPVAGTPGSLMGQMVASDYGLGADSVLLGGGASAGPSGNYASIGLQFDRYTSGGYDTSVTRLPLGYSFALDNGYRLSLDAPLSMADSEGAKSYNGSFGAALKIPLADNWALTPALRAGLAGSEELGSAALLYSGSLTSRYVWDFGALHLGMANMVGQYQSRELEVGDYNVDYTLSNTLLRNGLDLNGSFGATFLGDNTRWRVWVIDTRFSGDALFVEDYQEFGFSFGGRANFGGTVVEKVNVGLTYTRGNDLTGTRVNFGYKF